MKPKLAGTQLFVLNINIRDTNDNSPLFKEDILDVVVSETAKVGLVTNINQAKATDSDLGRLLIGTVVEVCVKKFSVFSSLRISKVI